MFWRNLKLSIYFFSTISPSRLFLNKFTNFLIKCLIKKFPTEPGNSIEFERFLLFYKGGTAILIISEDNSKWMYKRHQSIINYNFRSRNDWTKIYGVSTRKICFNKQRTDFVVFFNWIKRFLIEMCTKNKKNTCPIGIKMKNIDNHTLFALINRLLIDFMNYFRKYQLDDSFSQHVHISWKTGIFFTKEISSVNQMHTKAHY